MIKYISPKRPLVKALRISETENRALLTMCQVGGRTQSEMIREAIREAVTRRGIEPLSNTPEKEA